VGGRTVVTIRGDYDRAAQFLYFVEKKLQSWGMDSIVIGYEYAFHLSDLVLKNFIFVSSSLPGLQATCYQEKKPSAAGKIYGWQDHV
jgi:hypothetical protein